MREVFGAKITKQLYREHHTEQLNVKNLQYHVKLNKNNLERG